MSFYSAFVDELRKIGYMAAPPPSTRTHRRKLPTIKKPTEYIFKGAQAVMPFPGKDRPSLQRGAKSSTVRVGAEMGKYMPGATYQAVNYKGQPMGVNIKINTVQKMPVSALADVTRPQTAAAVVRHYGVGPSDQAEVITFEVRSG